MKKIVCTFLLAIVAIVASAQDGYVFPEDIKPLILTRWGQHHPFNLLCPKNATTGDNMLAGCGAVAMAQMVNYHRYPSKSPDGTYEYEWDLMFPSVTVTLRREEMVAVAKLISDCGVSSLTEYGGEASGTSLSRMMGALKRLFNYSDNMSIYERSQFTTPERDSVFRRLIFSELKAGRPVFYRGVNEKKKEAHLFIIDGCKKQKVHVNMGWAGNRDGYYDLDDLAGYSQQQWLLVDVADSNYHAPTNSVQLSESGTLGKLLDERGGPAARQSIRHLKLYGKMDKHDFATLREMLQTGLLRTIDMEEVELEQLPDSAFFECTYLSHFVAPRTLQRTGEHVFARCRNLNNVVFHDGLKAVSNAAFSGCTNLLSVKLPETTTHIGHNAFTSCEALLSIQLPEGIERIGNYAFSYCKHLYSISLPKSLNSFGKEVFKNCDRLTHIRLNPENPHFTVGESREILPLKTQPSI